MSQTTQPTNGQRIVQHMMATLGLFLEQIENRLIYDFTMGYVPVEYVERASCVLTTVQEMRALPNTCTCAGRSPKERSDWRAQRRCTCQEAH